MRTLVLDQTYFPVRVVGRQKAMILLLTGRAEVVDEYCDVDIRSVSQSFKLPKILRLFGRHKKKGEVRFTRHNVFLRDDFTCQYCGTTLPYQRLTFDHVIPRAKGGATGWDNVVTSCGGCNTKKGKKTLQEAGMRLQTWPQKPQWSPHLALRLSKDDPEEWFSWLPGKWRSSA